MPRKPDNVGKRREFSGHEVILVYISRWYILKVHILWLPNSESRI